MEQLHVKTRAQWRRWLSKNHNQSEGVWLVFFKKDSGQPTLAYDDAVEEALCFGWIDSIIKRRDETSYLRKLTPRKPDSRWSVSNKKRVEKMIREGLMKPPGMALFEAAKQSGAWDDNDPPAVSLQLSEAFQNALNKNKQAEAFFDGLAPSYQQQFIAWINVAKREETKARRIKESVALLAKGKRLGMK